MEKLAGNPEIIFFKLHRNQELNQSNSILDTIEVSISQSKARSEENIQNEQR